MTGKKLEPYPYRESGGASEIGAVRSIKMVAPYCPIEGNPMRGDKPNPRYTGEPNCQQAFKLPGRGKWDIAECEKRGHNPYYFTQESKVVENIVDEEGVIQGQRERVIGNTRLNVVQVSTGIRQTTNTSLQRALARGYKTLEEFGYESPCEYRGCYGKQNVDSRYGRYCSERHARLIAADVKKKVLPLRGGDPYTEDQMNDERDEILDALPISRT